MAEKESSGVHAAYRLFVASELEAGSLVELINRHVDGMSEGGASWEFLTAGVVGRLLERWGELELQLRRAGVALDGADHVG